MSAQAAIATITRKEAKQVTFVAFMTPEPQGSVKSFILPNRESIERAANQAAITHNRRAICDIIFQAAKTSQVIMTSDNNDLKKFRQHVGKCAEQGLWNADVDSKPMAGKHVPVEMVCTFYFERPASAKKRLYPVVRPDIDKLERAIYDACTGILYEDDSQIVSNSSRKLYGSPARVEVSLTVLEQPKLF
jgi:Holliday junction resolvase RusA-like endonuclease